MASKTATPKVTGLSHADAMAEVLEAALEGAGAADPAGDALLVMIHFGDYARHSQSFTPAVVGALIAIGDDAREMRAAREPFAEETTDG